VSGERSALEEKLLKRAPQFAGLNDALVQIWKRKYWELIAISRYIYLI
jgi:hypothetical protein